jgi:hypothetical protein
MLQRLRAEWRRTRKTDCWPRGYNSLHGQLCRTRSQSVLRGGEDLSCLDPHGIRLDGGGFCSQPIRAVSTRVECKHIPLARANDGPIPLVGGNAGRLGRHRHPFGCAAARSIGERAAFRNVESRSGIRRCNDSRPGACSPWNRHGYLSNTRSLRR